MAIERLNYTLEYVESLKNNGVAEGKTIEYKQEWYGDSDSQRKEFLKDVSAMANTDGGQIIIGVEEIEACISKIEGIIIEDIDAFGLKIQQQLSSSLNPKLFTVVVSFIPLKNQKYLVVLDIPKSWASPHMVSYRGGSSFYKRNSSGGVYQLDVYELKDAFLMTETIYEKLKTFRDKRYDLILNRNTLPTLRFLPSLIFHSIPLNSWVEKNDIMKRREKIYDSTPTPMFSHQYDRIRYNFHGVFATIMDDSMRISEFTQLFRDGTLEMATNNAFSDETIIASIIFKRNLISFTFHALKYQTLLGCVPPFVLFLSLYNVQNFQIALPRGARTPEITERDLVLPELMIDSIPDSVETTEDIIRPLFDMVWNAAGLPECNM